MKTIHDLQRFFDDDLHGALEEWYEKFMQETGQRGLDLFLAYLAQQNLLSPDKLNRMRSGQPVQIAKVESVAAGFVKAASSFANLKLQSDPDSDILIEDSEEPVGDAWSGVTPVAKLKTPGFFDVQSGIHDEALSHEPAQADTDDLDDMTEIIAPPPDSEGQLAVVRAHLAMEEEETPTPSSVMDAHPAEPSGPDYAESLPTGLPVGLVNRAAEADTIYPSEQTELSGFEDTRADDGGSYQSIEPDQGIAYQPTAALSEQSKALEDAIKVEDDNHEIIGELGRGAMGVVFIANEKNLGRKVAFKQIRPEVATEEELMMRFLREAQVTAQLDHPAIIPVHSLVKGFRGLPAYTMKVVEGTTLDVIIQEAKEHHQSGQPLEDSLSLSTRLEHFLKVCDAMAYAHSKGALHRDLKPNNVLVGRFGEAYVVDWGLARLMFSKEDADEDQIHLQSAPDFGNVKTEVGRLMGTPQYMSPEQAQGLIHDMDGRSDLYSLGVILFELVFLERALEADNILVAVNKIVKGELKEVPEQSPYESIPAGLPALIRKATAPKKEDRFESVKVFAEALRACLRHIGEPMTPPSKHVEPPPEKPSKGHLYGWIASAWIVLLALGVLWWLQQQHKLKVSTLQTSFAAQRAKIASQFSLSQDLSHEFARFFARVEGQIKSLSAAATVALTSSHKHKANTKKNKEATLYFNKNFLPPDVAPSKFYRDSISLKWPVVKLPETLHIPKTLKWSERRNRTQRRETLLGPLALLRRAQRDALFGSLPLKMRHLSFAAKRALLERGQVPLMATMIALPSGIVSLYPGRGSYPSSYNPTRRLWYQLARSKRGIRWSRPFINSQKLRVVTIACVNSLMKGHQLSGVVAGKVRLNTIAVLLQSLSQRHPWIDAISLLNEDGQILARSDRRLQNYNNSKIMPKRLTLRMPLHRDARLVKAIKARKPSGHFKRMGKDDRPLRLFYFRLHHPKWYFVLRTHPNKAQ